MKCIKFGRRARIITFAFATLLVGGATARAFGHGSPEKHAEFMVNRIKSKLDLNDQQAQKLEAIKNDWLAFHASQRGQHDKDREWVKSQVLGDKLDVDAALQLITQRRDVTDKKIPELLAKVAEFHQTLNKEQKEKVVDMLSHFARRHEG